MTEETLAHIQAQLFNDKLIGLGDATAVPPGCARAMLYVYHYTVWKFLHGLAGCGFCCLYLRQDWLRRQDVM